MTDSDGGKKEPLIVVAVLIAPPVRTASIAAIPTKNPLRWGSDTAGKVLPPLVRVFVSSISTQSRPSFTPGYWFQISL